MPQRELSIPFGWPGTFVPNFSDWRSGDILLVERTYDPIGHAIQASQATSFNAATRMGSIWSHAAIYVGSGMLVDATIADGVATRSVWNYCQGRSIQLRRLPVQLPAADIADIAPEALRHLGKSYSLLQVVVSKLIPGTVPAPNALYCSTFVGLVVANATGFDLSSEPQHRPLHPGTLAAHPDLLGVELEWRNL